MSETWLKRQFADLDRAKARIADLEAEVERLADLWPAAPTSFGTTKEWNAGFVAGLEAFRASIRRTIAERSKT